MKLKSMSRAAAVVAVAAIAGAAALPAVAQGDHPARHRDDGDHGGAHAHLPTTYTLPGNALFPEGMGYDRRTGDFYTGSVTDGTIVRGNVLNRQAQVFSPPGADGRTRALGMRTDRTRLYVAGGATGTVWVYDKSTGTFIAKLSNGLPSTGTTLNDLTVTSSGVYVTDSLSPTLWRIAPGPDGKLTMEKWLDFTGTAFQYTTGYNADGIQATPDGRFLIWARSTPASCTASTSRARRSSRSTPAAPTSRTRMASSSSETTSTWRATRTTRSSSWISRTTGRAAPSTPSRRARVSTSPPRSRPSARGCSS
jgi:hypothetical protein